MGNLKIGTRLYAGFGLLVAILLAVVVVAVIAQGKLNDATTEITTNWLPSVEKVNQMNTATSDYRVLEMKHALNTDDAKMAAIEKEMAANEAELAKRRKDYEPLISSPEEQKLYESFVADHDAYMKSHVSVLEASRRNDSVQALKLLNENEPLFVRFSETLDKLVQLNHDGAVVAKAAAEAAYSTGRMVMAVAVVLAVVLAVVIGSAITDCP